MHRQKLIFSIIALGLLISLLSAFVFSPVILSQLPNNKNPIAVSLTEVGKRSFPFTSSSYSAIKKDGLYFINEPTNPIPTGLSTLSAALSPAADTGQISSFLKLPVGDQQGNCEQKPTNSDQSNQYSILQKYDLTYNFIWEMNLTSSLSQQYPPAVSKQFTTFVHQHHRH